MRILFFATLREITREREIEWSAPAKTAGELLRALCVRYGAEFHKWAFDGDELGEIIIVLVNGRDIRHLARLETPLSPDDTVAVFPMVAGG